MKLIAHRGARHRHCPYTDDRAEYQENTIPSFRAAAEGRFAIKFDVRSTIDGIAVVKHDDEISFGTSLIRVSETTLRDLHEEGLIGVDNRIPTLLDVFREMRGRHELYVELKNEGSAHALNHSVTLYQRIDPHILDRVVVSSRHLSELIKFRGFQPEAMLAWTMDTFDEHSHDFMQRVLKGHRIFELHLEAQAVHSELARWVVCILGIPIKVFTVNDPALALNLRSLNASGKHSPVSGIFTDFPSAMHEVLAAGAV